MNSRKPLFYIKTLGCKVNQYETEEMRQALVRSGFQETSDMRQTDIFVMNSCTVTHRADKDARRLIRQCRSANKKAKIIVAGCSVELEEDRKIYAGMDGVSLLLSNSEKRDISRYLSDEFKLDAKDPGLLESFSGHDRAFIKIQDGCNHRCSFCKVSIVRGKSRPRPAKEILLEVKSLVKAGYKELVLTGVCLGSWGDIDRLLEEIVVIEGDFRVRLSSIEPRYVTDGLINVIKKSEKICKHLHVPLQSGDDKILESMNRGYTSGQFLKLISKVRTEIQDIAFTTDIIIGYPGEDEESFNKTCDFLMKIAPSRVHFFGYSPRKGTKAYNLKRAPDTAAVKKRIKKAERIADSIADKYRKSFIGKSLSVLVESQRDPSSNMLTGYTDNYVKVYLDGPDNLMGEITSIEIKDGTFLPRPCLNKCEMGKKVL